MVLDFSEPKGIQILRGKPNIKFDLQKSDTPRAKYMAEESDLGQDISNLSGIRCIPHYQLKNRFLLDSFSSLHSRLKNIPLLNKVLVLLRMLDILNLLGKASIKFDPLNSDTHRTMCMAEDSDFGQDILSLWGI
jgi:hypothetical protein